MAATTIKLSNIESVVVGLSVELLTLDWVVVMVVVSLLVDLIFVDVDTVLLVLMVAVMVVLPFVVVVLSVVPPATGARRDTGVVGHVTSVVEVDVVVVVLLSYNGEHSS